MNEPPKSKRAVTSSDAKDRPRRSSGRSSNRIPRRNIARNAALKKKPYLYLFSVPRSAYKQSLSLYDGFKALAFMLILIQSFALYVTPISGWLPIFGFMGAPILFFLIGYEGRQDISMVWLCAGAVLSLIAPVFGFAAFPLDLMITLVLCAALTQILMRFLVKHDTYFWYFFILLVFLAPLSGMLVAYGTLAFLFSLLGHVVKKEQRKKIDVEGNYRKCVIAAVYACYCLMFVWIFGVSEFQFAVFLIFSAGIFYLLINMHERYSAKLTHNPFAEIIQFVGFNIFTLYILQLLFFKVLSGLLGGFSDLFS